MNCEDCRDDNCEPISCEYISAIDTGDYTPDGPILSRLWQCPKCKRIYVS